MEKPSLARASQGPAYVQWEIKLGWGIVALGAMFRVHGGFVRRSELFFFVSKGKSPYFLEKGCASWGGMRNRVHVTLERWALEKNVAEEFAYVGRED